MFVWRTHCYFPSQNSQVVPTEHNSRRGKVTETHQYSVSEYAINVSSVDAAVVEVSLAVCKAPTLWIAVDFNSCVQQLLIVPQIVVHNGIETCGGATIADCDSCVQCDFCKHHCQPV